MAGGGGKARCSRGNVYASVQTRGLALLLRFYVEREGVLQWRKMSG
ncbi:hypothetical protein GEOBRER4_n0591 [Citrifermentans bremense]|uniref:Uncharacterized protein n=2 Tax=Geobacteraceae TaxID=213422 RepID=A0ABQ0ML15_9BACT|nr:hypothetical protein GEOBRER4_n0591 [Citrifermentans bremense]GAW67734.1 hypothetical protein GPEL0_01r3732 [Geoanaerobacter pelophilus]